MRIPDCISAMAPTDGKSVNLSIRQWLDLWPQGFQAGQVLEGSAQVLHGVHRLVAVEADLVVQVGGGGAAGAADAANLLAASYDLRGTHEGLRKVGVVRRDIALAVPDYHEPAVPTHEAGHGDHAIRS